MPRRRRRRNPLKIAALRLTRQLVDATIFWKPVNHPMHFTNRKAGDTIPPTAKSKSWPRHTFSALLQSGPAHKHESAQRAGREREQPPFVPGRAPGRRAGNYSFGVRKSWRGWVSGPGRHVCPVAAPVRGHHHARHPTLFGPPAPAPTAPQKNQTRVQNIRPAGHAYLANRFYRDAQARGPEPPVSVRVRRDRHVLQISLGHTPAQKQITSNKRTLDRVARFILQLRELFQKGPKSCSPITNSARRSTKPFWPTWHHDAPLDAIHALNERRGGVGEQNSEELFEKCAGPVGWCGPSPRRAGPRGVSSNACTATTATALRHRHGARELHRQGPVNLAISNRIGLLDMNAIDPQGAVVRVPDHDVSLRKARDA